MDRELRNKPSIALWKNELANILEDKRNIEIRKLGSVGAYIENVFLYSDDKKHSIDCFREAFNEFITLEKIQINSSKQCLEIIISIIDTFKNSKDFCTSTTKYFTSLTELIQKLLTSNDSVFEYESILFTYIIYVNYVQEQKQVSLDNETVMKRKVIQILTDIIGLSDRISSLSLYILLCVEEKLPVTLESVNDEVKINLLRYSLSDKVTRSKDVNQHIIEFAILYKNLFETELQRFDCKLNDDCNTLIYKEGLVQRDLEPDYFQWEQLHDVYYNNDLSNDDKLQTSLTKHLIC